VPLEHFLFTGNSKATSKELFKLVDSRGRLLPDGRHLPFAGFSVSELHMFA
jgi:hypothetical protein